jgi:hypothetical protein
MLRCVRLRYGIERTRINAISSGRRPITESVVDALGRRVHSPRVNAPHKAKNPNASRCEARGHKPVIA